MRKIEDSDIHKGHRARMRRKLDEYGGEIFDTYELLEMLLYGVIPAKDTNPISKRLLAAFGSLDGVLSASREELLLVEGVGAKTAELILSVGSLGELFHYQVDASDTHLDDYSLVGELFASMIGSGEEQKIAALLLDNSMRPLGKKILYTGLDYPSAGVRVGEIVSYALSYGASVVMLAHSHPYGPLYPSEGDNNMNNAVASALLDVGVLLAEHYIISGDRYLGFISKIKKQQLLQQPELRHFYESKLAYTGEAAL